MAINITSLTRQYVNQHPSVRDCLMRGLLNHSALAREVCEYYSIDAFDAVLKASKRYAAQYANRESQESQIVSLLKSARLRIKNQIAVAIINKPESLERFYSIRKEVRLARGDFNLIEGEEVVTVVTNEEFLALIRRQLRGRVLSTRQGLAQVTLMFGKKIETTPGVVSFVYGLLAQRGVNVLEEMSCWTDLMLVIEEKDLSGVINLLKLE